MIVLYCEDSNCSIAMYYYDADMNLKAWYGLDDGIETQLYGETMTTWRKWLKESLTDHIIYDDGSL